MQKVYIEVAVYIEEGFDPHEVISDCDYSFSGEGIVRTEITEIVDQD